MRAIRPAPPPGANPLTRPPGMSGGPQSVKIVELNAPDAPKPPNAEPEPEGKALSREELKGALDKTLEVVDLLCPRRHLEYEVIEEADLVQVQVVNTDDGSIVRKIPSDDIVRLVEQIHRILAERFEVEA